MENSPQQDRVAKIQTAFKLVRQLIVTHMKNEIIEKTFKDIAILENIVYSNESNFIRLALKLNQETFLCGWGLKGIWFSENSVRVEYVLEDGQHVVDTLPMEDFKKWLVTMGEI